MGNYFKNPFGLFVLTALALTGVLCWPGSVWAQKTPLLEMEEEEEPAKTPPKGKPADAGENPASGKPSLLTEEEEEPLEGRKVATGGGKLDDLLAGDGKKNVREEQVQVELVADLLLGQFSSDRGGSKSRLVELQPTWLDKSYKFPVQKKFNFVQVTGKKGRNSLTIDGDKILHFLYYEERMLKRAAEEFGVDAETLAKPGAEFPLSPAAKAQAAERALTVLETALAEHDSARQRALRRGADWNKLRDPLVASIANLEFSQIRQLLAERKIQPAVLACDRLRNRGETSADRGGMSARVRKLFVELFVVPAEEALLREDFGETRRLMAEFSDRYPNAPEPRVTDLRKRLMQRVQGLVEQAKQNRDPKLLEKAAAVWPGFAGLEDERRKIQTKYPTLHCAYTSLPQKFSPLTAESPVERHAVALMFESLVQWVDDPVAGPHYTSQFADGRPLPLAKGREFRLPSGAWSVAADGTPMMYLNEDVFCTVAVLKKVRPHGFPAAWNNLIGDVVNVHDQHDRVLIKFQRDHWQPLSLLDFMVLPRTSFPLKGTTRELANFDARPIGTGPYRRADDDGDGDVDKTRFVANPNYRRAGLPRIREVVFHRADGLKAVAEFGKGNFDLIYDLSFEHANQLRLKNADQVKSLPPRGVYFLAPNYRQLSPLVNEDLRLAVAHAIDRNAILNTVFRGGQIGASKEHAPLTGPYLSGTWAYSPKDLAFSINKAKLHANKAKASFSAGLPPLRLMYPDRDAPIGAACQRIFEQVRDNAGLVIDLRPIPPESFHHKILTGHDFDLAYWRHDFKDETYWIWSLFNPDDDFPGGANFMGIRPEEDFRSMFDEMLTHKQFRKIQDLTQQTHEYIARHATVIPLWQLNTHVAVGPRVRGARLDPVHLFQNVEKWSLEVK